MNPQTKKIENEKWLQFMVGRIRSKISYGYLVRSLIITNFGAYGVRTNRISTIVDPLPEQGKMMYPNC